MYRAFKNNIGNVYNYSTEIYTGRFSLIFTIGHFVRVLCEVNHLGLHRSRLLVIYYFHIRTRGSELV